MKVADNRSDDIAPGDPAVTITTGERVEYDGHALTELACDRRGRAARTHGCERHPAVLPGQRPPVGRALAVACAISEIVPLAVTPSLGMGSSA